MIDKFIQHTKKDNLSVNVERLNAITDALRADLSRSDILSQLQQLVSALQNQVTQPGQPVYEQQVSQFHESLRTALANSAINSFSPTWQQVLEELGIANLLGQQLEYRIEDIFSRNKITPTIAQQELQQILTELQAFMSSLDNLSAAFRQLQIGSEELERGDCEMGILVPRTFVDNRLDKFSEELVELNRIFGVFAEISTGSRPGFKIRTISSSALTIFLNVAPAVGACIAVAIERIISLYKQLLEIRKLQGELKKQGMTKKDLKGIEDHANNIMDKGIEKLVQELLTEFHVGADEGRKNELSIELKYSLTKVANRVDRGFNIEVRMAEPEETDADTETEEEQADAIKHHARIQGASETLQFLRLDGDPILSLPEEKTEKPKKPA
jgi:hypothetical protein